MKNNEENKLQLLRKHAQAALKNMTNPPDFNAETIEDLAHELQVYYVELELQNQTLQITQQELEASQREYQDLFDYAPVAYFILDKQGVILKANRTATETFGAIPKDLSGSLLADYVTTEFQDTYHLHLRNLIRSGESQSDEIIFLHQDGTRFYASINSTLNGVEDKAYTIRVAINNIHELKVYEQRLQSLHELDQAILQSRNTSEFVDVALRHLLQFTPCQHCSILIFDLDTDIVHIFSKSHIEMIRQTHIRQRSELPQYLLSDKKQVVQITDSLLFDDDIEVMLTIPIQQANQHIGSIWLGATSTEFVGKDITQISDEIAMQLGIAIQKVRLIEQIGKQTKQLELRVAKRTQELHKSEQNEHIQRVFAESMLDIVRGLNSTFDLEQVLDRILLNLERVIHYQVADILLIEDNIGRIVKRRDKITENIEHSVEAVIDIHTTDPYRDILKTEQSVWIYDTKQPKTWNLPGWSKYTTAYIGVPIRSEDVTLGILNIYSSQASPFSSQQREHLHAFAEQAAIALRNARLHIQEQNLAVLEERQRLARDLHDAVSQNLFSLRMLADALSIEDDENREILDHITELAQSTQAEMRLLLLELRPMSIDKMDISDLLNKLTQAFRGRKPRNIYTSIDQVDISLSIDVKTHLFRIAQEALNNVIKHTHRGDVRLSLRKDREQLILLVEDEGQGFDVTKKQLKGNGLSIMRERAEKIGAEISISSDPGNGSQIKVVLSL